MTVTIISQNMTMRPPNLSVHMPSGTRISEPVSTGVAVRMPNWVELRFSVFLIGTPITPNIIHTMKHTVKANVLTISTDHALVLCDLPAPRALLPSLRPVCPAVVAMRSLGSRFLCPRIVPGIDRRAHSPVAVAVRRGRGRNG
jgi:hypothetical protein